MSAAGPDMALLAPAGTTPLTPREMVCLGIIIEWWGLYGHAPSFAELAHEMSVATKSNIADIVGSLTRKGWLRERAPHAMRRLIPLHPVPIPSGYEVAITPAGEAYLAENTEASS